MQKYKNIFATAKLKYNNGSDISMYYDLCLLTQTIKTIMPIRCNLKGITKGISTLRTHSMQELLRHQTNYEFRRQTYIPSTNDHYWIKKLKICKYEAEEDRWDNTPKVLSNV